MARRSTSQKKIDDAAFPVRVRIVVPEYGFGPDLIAMRRWLSTEIGDADHAAHSDASGRLFRQHPVSHSGVSGHLRIVAA